MRLSELSIEEQREIANKILNKVYGQTAKVREEIKNKYGISDWQFYRWREQLLESKELVFDANSFIKARSTLVDAEGNVKMQWVKEDTKATDMLESLSEAVEAIMSRINAKEEIPVVEMTRDEDSFNLYINSDLHIGALMDETETGDRDWDRKIAMKTIKASIDYLVKNSPTTKVGVVIDLGDILEIDDFKNATPKSGNKLDVDGRYSKILDVALEATSYMVEKALEKHEIVHFININGNHDITSGHAIRAYMRAYFRNNPRVIIDESHKEIKYFCMGSTLLGFAHGDGLKMRDAGEVMVADNESILSTTSNRYFHFGHIHKDSVYDGRLCRSESHRNLSPLNNWAAHMGYRRQAGTMKCITYHSEFGEINRTTFNVNMVR